MPACYYRNITAYYAVPTGGKPPLIFIGCAFLYLHLKNHESFQEVGSNYGVNIYEFALRLRIAVIIIQAIKETCSSLLPIGKKNFHQNLK